MLPDSHCLNFFFNIIHALFGQYSEVKHVPSICNKVVYTTVQIHVAYHFTFHFRSDITAILLSTLSFLWSCCKSVPFLLDARCSVAPFPAIHSLCSCLLTTLVRSTKVYCIMLQKLLANVCGRLYLCSICMYTNFPFLLELVQVPLQPQIQSKLQHLKQNDGIKS